MCLQQYMQARSFTSSRTGFCSRAQHIYVYDRSGPAEKICNSILSSSAMVKTFCILSSKRTTTDSAVHLKG